MELRLRVNDEKRAVPGTEEPAELDKVLATLAMRRELVTIALNDPVVPRSR